ncbi:MAG: hypothetical protein KF796_02295 [Ramlibacter sp.]|nr:hypothetical protein [Ramlibacter sp.]
MSKRALKFPSCYELAISPGQAFVASLGRDVVVASLAQRERRFSSRALAHPAHAAFNTGEARLAVKNTSGDMITLDLSDGQVIARLNAKGHDEGAAIHYSACDHFLVDGSWNGAIRVRRADTLDVVEEFTYENEMITSVSKTDDGSLWLFAHQPKTRDGENFPEPPYMTLWDWPLRKPIRRIDPHFHSVGTASISPCGTWIATRGRHRALSDGTLLPDELRISDASGEARWSTNVTFSGTAYRARWSADGRLVGTVDRSGVLVFTAEGLTPQRTVSAEFASDVAFIDDGTSAVIGTWSRAWVEVL